MQIKKSDNSKLYYFNDSWNKFEELYIGKDVSLESFNKEYIAIWKDFEDKIEKEN